MIVLMIEFVQGRNVSGTDTQTGDHAEALAQGREYEVSEELGKWLLETRKAHAVTKTPAPVFEEVIIEIEPDAAPEEEPAEESEPAKTPRRRSKK